MNDAISSMQTVLSDYTDSGLPPKDMEHMCAVVEAILFAAGEPVEVDVIASALEIGPTLCLQLLESMREAYSNRLSGIVLIKLDTSYQLCSNPDYIEPVRAVLDKKRDVVLSIAALEVLSITAYNQPVTRAFLEQVRGVDSSGVVSSLLEKGLLEERGRMEAPGRPMQFGTTHEFLRCFGLSTLDDLPPIDERESPIVQYELNADTTSTLTGA